MKKILAACFLFISAATGAQDMNFARSVVDTLTSPYFWGRGYTNDGMRKAAHYLGDQFQTLGLNPLNGKSYFQELSWSVNTFPGKMQVAIDGKELVPGKDFIVSPESRGVKGKGNLAQLDSVQFLLASKRVLVKLENKLTWSVAPEATDFTLIQVDKKAVSSNPASITVEIENKFVPQFKAANVCAMVKGTVKPDSFLFFTAHYDHLGGMGGDTYFPGANDNASGTALLLNLAKHYAKNPPPYSVAFICFAGEEAGLVGSKYFTENPLIPLKQIKFLINTDLAGTGEEGITVVNATEFPNEFALMQKINTDHQLLAAVNARGKAANSDHYFFTERGVPALYFYTLGGIKAYHDVFDKAATLPLNEHADLFTLLTKFYDNLMGK